MFMQNKVVEISFKKLLGNGRAWRTPSNFTSEFLEILISPFAELKEKFINLKYTHFPTFFQDENNIKNDEELFGIKKIDIKDKTLSERAANVENHWKMLAGSSSFQEIENALIERGFKIRIEENSSNAPNLGSGFFYGATQYGEEKEGKKAQYGGHFSKVLGNGPLEISGMLKDPAQFLDGKNAFYIFGYFDPTDDDWNLITETILKIKPAQSVAICKIAERKIADNQYYNTTVFADRIDGGTPFTTDFVEHLNKDG